MIQRIDNALRLRFKEETGWTAIPPWAKFFISLGAALSTVRSNEQRVVAALSVPTSSFASAFIALGRILSEPILEPARSAVDDHFETLAALPPQTPLIYFNGEALFEGPFLGILKHSNVDCLRMAIKGGTCIIPKQRSLLVEVQPDAPVGKAVCHVRRLRNPKPFVGHFFSLVDHYRILCNTAKSVVIVGEKNRLRNEVIQTPFSVPDGNVCAEGVLQDLIRIAKFSSGGLGCRADVYARSRTSMNRNGHSSMDNALLVLDGASSYLRWAHEYPRAHIVAILSRTESEYGTAVDSLNAAYLGRLDDCSLPGLSSSPPGIELMVHVEPRR